MEEGLLKLNSKLEFMCKNHSSSVIIFSYFKHCNIVQEKKDGLLTTIALLTTIHTETSGRESSVTK